MALLIEDPELQAEILAESERSRISPEEVVRRAMAARRERVKARYDAMLKYLEEDVWPHVPADQLGRRLTKAEEEELLGYGPGEF